jgi:hypothetical protein
VTEQPEDTPPAPRRSVEVALARMEAKLDVAIAQHQARLEDHARRMAALEQERAVDAARIAALEQVRAADEAREKAEAANRPAPIGPVGWISLAITILLALYVLLDHYGAPG